MKQIFTLFLISLFVVSGCSWTKKEKTAQELADEGIKEFDKENYRNAIDNFEKLKDWYPFSKHAKTAELKIADSHFHLEEYEEAVVTYEEFEGLHPRNESIPYVIYQIGYCYFVQVDTVDRDQANALKALDTFRRLVKQFPDNEYAAMATKNITKCLKSITGHELYVGRFYFKTKYYKAALYRFQTVITEYPDVGSHKEALEYIALCAEALEKQEFEDREKKE
ncbi:MAG: outer membrane protein assembly factor BamD [Desulfobacterales bacterium]|nr:outer membrane protein assembly factor BamD [Desulfobacterales bacterium]